MTISEGLIQDRMKKTYDQLDMEAVQVEKSAMSIIPENAHQLDKLLQDVLIKCFLKTGDDVQKLAKLTSWLINYMQMVDLELNAIKKEILEKR